MQSLTETLLKQFPEAVRSVDVDTARSEVTVHVAAPGNLRGRSVFT